MSVTWITVLFLYSILHCIKKRFLIDLDGDGPVSISVEQFEGLSVLGYLSLGQLASHLWNVQCNVTDCFYWFWTESTK